MNAPLIDHAPIVIEQPSAAAADRVEECPELDLPEVWGHGSFPASDPPANW